MPDFLNGGESLGMPPDIAAQSGQWRPKRGLIAALFGTMAPEATAAETPATTQPIHRFEDEKGAPRYGGAPQADDLEQGATAQRASLAQAMRSANQTDAPSVPDHLAQMQARYDAMNAPQQPLGLKQTLKQMIQPQNLVRGGVLALAGPQARQQYQQRQEFEEGQRGLEKRSLLQEIEAERRIQEQERGQTERAQAAQEAQSRLFAQQKDIEGMKEREAQDRLDQTLRQQQEGLDQKLQQQSEEFNQRFSKQGDVGTWSLQTTADGQTVLFNSKTREIAPAGGLVPKGTGQLTPATQGILQTTAPVKDQVQQLLKSLDDYIAQKPGNDQKRMTLGRLKYALGQESPEQDITEQISKLELNRVMAGARVLKGSSRAYQALELAMKHAPNPWLDEAGLMRQKLQNILQNLNDVEKDAVRYGTKGQTAADVAGSMPPESTPPKVTPKAPAAKLKDRVVGRVLVEGEDF